MTTTLITTETSGTQTTTTAVQTVAIDGCVLDEFNDDTLVAWYNGTHRHPGYVDIVHDPGMHTPDGILTIVGTLDAGDLAAVQTFGGPKYNVSEANGTPGFDIRFNFTGLTERYTNIHCGIYVWYGGNSGHTVEVQAWNYTSGTWGICDTITDGVAFAWFNSTHLGVGSDLVSGGILRGRIYHVSPGNINHDIYIDYIELTADVNPSGQVWSTNMLVGLNVTNIVRFRYDITIPVGGGAYGRVQFSQDNATWVDSGGIAQWEDMTDGDHTILLTGLGWAGNFYYRVEMYKDIAGTSPTLDLVQVCYSTIAAGGSGWNFIVVVTIILTALAVVIIFNRRRSW